MKYFVGCRAGQKTSAIQVDIKEGGVCDVYGNRYDPQTGMAEHGKSQLLMPTLSQSQEEANCKIRELEDGDS